MVLHDLDALRFKACYHSNCESATISELQLETTKDDQINGDSYTATSVEMCQCPPPYTGLSCQQCAPGYHRVNSGRYLGACVPCNCNGHSGSCDPATGICFDCQHDTVGEHCEFCREGFYGDATTGGPYSCMPCACPMATDANNFAISCQACLFFIVSEAGLLQSCLCKEGYTSDHCERCDVGYYGDPTAMGGSCQKCDCSENNDLSIDGSCHPVSGDCDLCLNNTGGTHCEQCKSWYYGDALVAKNCTGEEAILLNVEFANLILILDSDSGYFSTTGHSSDASKNNALQNVPAISVVAQCATTDPDDANAIQT
ncbi:unnamed protein product [Gongylonema pulchrum]|uniref:Laminin EGF-like domain-containing protein n=1 Tax=Gongylonema pulchrum TaxID=637853 RepID=A0A183CV57_9BILA|nr:unnamed protein product [Gongylonema pulchrum]